MALDILSHQFRLAFTFKIAFQALDRDILNVIKCCIMEQYAHLCTRDRVQPPLPPNHSLLSYNLFGCYLT